MSRGAEASLREFVDLIKCVTSGTSDVQKYPVLVNHLYLQIESQICLEDSLYDLK